MEHTFIPYDNPHAKSTFTEDCIKDYLKKPESERRVSLGPVTDPNASPCYVGTVTDIDYTNPQVALLTVNIDESLPDGKELVRSLQRCQDYYVCFSGEALLDYPNIVTHQKIFDVSLHQAKNSAEDGYVPREITHYEYDMVCESSQHFTETYEQYCNRIHNKEHAEYLHNKYRPVENTLQSAVVPDNNGNLHLIYFMAKVHMLENGKCTKMYVPTKFDESSIAVMGEENFRKFVEKYDGKTEVDL